jgi:two-component system C4-dicarboxylate transport response regulator DctD
MTRAAQRMLAEHQWPGNVRELANFAERFALGLETFEDVAAPAGPGASLRDKVEQFEADLIREALTAGGGDVRKALDALGLPRETFYAKARKHGIDIESYRATGRYRMVGKHADKSQREDVS